MKAVFHGKCNDANVHINLRHDNVQYQIEEKHINLSVNILINSRTVSVVCEFSEKIDIYTARNLVKQTCYNVCCLFSFYYGTSLYIDIENIVIDREIIAYRDLIGVVSNKNRENFCGNRNVASSPESQIILINKYPHLSDVFLMFNHSLKEPLSTGLFSYICIEMICRHFCGALKISERSWKKFRDSLLIEKEVIMNVKNTADPYRHGNIVGISDKTRAMVIFSTAVIIDRYINYLTIVSDDFRLITMQEILDNI